MIEKTAKIHWEDPDKKGKGQISTETGALDRYPYGFASRFEDDRRGTNPQEILAAEAEISLQAKLEVAAL
jgi:osmotically inducible protein OsmC